MISAVKRLVPCPVLAQHFAAPGSARGPFYQDHFPFLTFTNGFSSKTLAMIFPGSIKLVSGIVRPQNIVPYFDMAAVIRSLRLIGKLPTPSIACLALCDAKGSSSDCRIHRIVDISEIDTFTESMVSIIVFILHKVPVC